MACEENLVCMIQYALPAPNLPLRPIRRTTCHVRQLPHKGSVKVTRRPCDVMAACSSVGYSTGVGADIRYACMCLVSA